MVNVTQQQPPLLIDEQIPTRVVVDAGHAYEREKFLALAEELPFAGLMLALIENEGWYWRDAAYIAWKSIPQKYRRPETAYELDEMLGMAQGGMMKRRQRNPAIDQRAARAIVSGQLFDAVDGVIEALIESASNPNYKNHPDRKLALEMTGQYTPKQGIDLEVGQKLLDPAELTEADLRRMAGQLEAGTYE
jgi:hypothetical protein